MKKFKFLSILFVLLLFNNVNAVSVNKQCGKGYEKQLSSVSYFQSYLEDIIPVDTFIETTDPNDEYGTIEKNSTIIGNTKFTAEEIITAKKASIAGYNNAMNSVSADNAAYKNDEAKIQIYIYYGEVGGWYSIDENNNVTYLDNPGGNITKQKIYAIDNVRKGIYLLSRDSAETICVNPGVYAVKNGDKVDYYLSSGVNETKFQFNDQNVEYSYNKITSKKIVVDSQCINQENDNCTSYNVNVYVRDENDNNVEGNVKIWSDTLKRYTNVSVGIEGYEINEISNVPQVIFNYDNVPDVEFTHTWEDGQDVWHNTDLVVSFRKKTISTEFEYTFDSVDEMEESKLDIHRTKNNEITIKNDTEPNRARLRLYVRQVDSNGEVGNWSRPLYINIDKTRPNVVEWLKYDDNYYIFNHPNDSNKKILVMSAIDSGTNRPSNLSKLAYKIDNGELQYTDEKSNSGYFSGNTGGVGYGINLGSPGNNLSYECSIANKYLEGANCPLLNGAKTVYYIINLPDKTGETQEHSITIYAIDVAGNNGPERTFTYNY